MNLITTITVNQWHIRDNAEGGAQKPVLCVNTYHRNRDGSFGEKVGETVHMNEVDILVPSKVVYDPINKTPCGASCWMQVEGSL